MCQTEPWSCQLPHFNSTSFRVRGTIFLIAPPAGGYLYCFVDAGTQEQSLALHAQFIAELHWDENTTGIRMQLENAPPTVVRELILKAWECTSPNSSLKASGAPA